MGKWAIPLTTDSVLRDGDQGVVVWSLQVQCGRHTDAAVLPDGFFGDATKAAVKELQRMLVVVVDGIAGPKTQSVFSEYVCGNQGGLPRRLLWSKVSYESSGLLGAVNWRVPGGVDCGVTQRRIVEANYHDDAVIERAFDATYQIRLSARTLRERFGAWLGRPGIGGRIERCWRVAVLAHNYPALAERLADGWVEGLSDYYRTPQKWVEANGLTFPDGHPIRTPLEWGQRYALGSSPHQEPGRAVRLVTDWES